MEKAWLGVVVVGSSIEWLVVGRRVLVEKGDAEPVEGRCRHFQQLEEAMVTIVSGGLVDMSRSVVCHGPGGLSKS